MWIDLLCARMCLSKVLLAAILDYITYGSCARTKVEIMGVGHVARKKSDADKGKGRYVNCNKGHERICLQ